MERAEEKIQSSYLRTMDCSSPGIGCSEGSGLNPTLGHRNARRLCVSMSSTRRLKRWSQVGFRSLSTVRVRSTIPSRTDNCNQASLHCHSSATPERRSTCSTWLVQQCNGTQSRSRGPRPRCKHKQAAHKHGNMCALKVVGLCLLQIQTPLDQKVISNSLDMPRQVPP